MKRTSSHPQAQASGYPQLVSEDQDHGLALAGVTDEPPPPPPADEEDAEDEGQSYELGGPAWQGYLFGLVPVVVLLLGAGRETWSKALAAVLAALVMIVFAPRRKLPLVPGVALLGALVAPLLALLPAGWLHAVPAWRSHLTADWEIHLSDRLTPQMWVTMEAWMFFGLCLLWLAWSLMRGFSTVQRRAMIQTLAAGGAVLCVLSILDATKWIQMTWWPRNQQAWGDAFGPFANRNHTSSLAAMTVVLCAALVQDAHRRKSRLWLAWFASIFPAMACIFMNTSKAGVILLFGGLTVWFGASAMRKGFFQKLAVSASLVFIIATLAVMSGGGITSRLNSTSLEELTSTGARGMLLGETLGMMIDAPWLGIGLGNFESVFPLVTSIHEPRSRFIHPESDLLWLLAEGGLLTLLPAGLLLMWIFLSTGPWYRKRKKSSASRQDRRLRNAAAIVFGMGAVHGVVDVPNHGLGFALFMALLAGVAVRPRRLKQSATLPVRLLGRAGGLAVLALGVAWGQISLGHPVLPGASSAQMLRQRANYLTDSGSIADALPLMNRAIDLMPMDFHLYYERAHMRLYLGQPDEDALLDFSRSRALEPHYAALCYTEGVLWLDFDPQYAVVGWREFIRRYPAAAPGIYGYYRQMLNHAGQHPQLRESLWSLATSADLKLDYLERVQTREEFDRCLRSLLAMQPALEGLEPSQREALFGIWSRMGDQDTLMKSLEANRKWRDDGWRILAEYYAKNSEFQKACQVAMPYLPSMIRTSPGTSLDIPALERALLYNPTDARRGIDLFQAQKKQGDIDAALSTLEKVGAMPNAPPYVQQEIASLYMAREDYRRAWEHLREAMQKR